MKRWRSVVGITIALMSLISSPLLAAGASPPPLRRVVTPETKPEIPILPPTGPLSIPSQRAKSYPGGIIRTTRQYGPMLGYSLSEVHYPSNGQLVGALVATPASAVPIFGYPVIILAHGYIPGPDYRTDGPDYRDYIAAFARAGYVVFKPDYEGYGSSTGEPRSAYFDPADTGDILNLAASLATYPNVNPLEVGLFGHSMGGHVALNAITVRPKRFAAAVIASGGVGTIDDMFYNWEPSASADSALGKAQQTAVIARYGTPSSNPTFWNNVSPLTYAASITTPTELDVGTADTVIPPRFTSELAAALTAAGHPPVATYSYVGAGHVYTGTVEQQVIARSIAFYNRTVKRSF